MSLYAKRGVSAQKEEVHAATANLDAGLYERAFCKIYPDLLGEDKNWVNVMHADGAGTKSILAYLYWKETGDASVWRGIAQDAVVMNLDDLLCVGIYDRIIFNSTIDRNKLLIPGEVIREIVEGNQDLFNMLQQHGIGITYLGGETADVGDVVRTIAVNGTMAVRWPKEKLVTNDKIAAGQAIVGLASFGRSNYENAYNSGIGSNGLTSARHDILNAHYRTNYPEASDPNLDPAVTYSGKFRLTDPSPVEGVDIGHLLLSPTRTFAPILRDLLTNHFDKIKGLVHCSGGGQTKCLKFMPDNIRVVKNNLWEPPPLFQLIKDASGADWKEMCQVFNLGCRLEIYCDPEDMDLIIATAHSYDVEAQQIGYLEPHDARSLEISIAEESITFAS